MYLCELEFSSFLDICPRLRWLDQTAALFQFFEETPYCSPQWLCQSTLPPTAHEGPLSHTWPAFSVYGLSKLALPTRVRRGRTVLAALGREHPSGLPAAGEGPASVLPLCHLRPSSGPAPLRSLAGTTTLAKAPAAAASDQHFAQLHKIWLHVTKPDFI